MKKIAKKNGRHTLTTSFLRAHDDLRYVGKLTEEENNEGDTLLSSYGNTYFWSTLDSYLSDKLVGKTITSVGRVDQSREDQVLDDFFLLPDMRVNDERKQDIFGLKSDWEFEATRDILLRAGSDLRHVAADYNYTGYTCDYEYYAGWANPYQLVGTEANTVSINPSGNKISSYLSNRVRLAKFLTGELGVRYDRTSYSDDDIKSLYYFNEDVLVNYNEEFAFPYDQLHTLYLDLNYRFNLNWQFNVAWQFHTGWPYTEVFLNTDPEDVAVSYQLEAGDPWRARHDPFKRLDLRVNRKFFTSRGTLTAFIEVVNVLGADNIRNYEYTLVSDNGVLSIEKVTEKWFGTMPSFGITYDYFF